MAIEQGAECLYVMADDTDVYNLMLHYYNQKELNMNEGIHSIFFNNFLSF